MIWHESLLMTKVTFFDRVTLLCVLLMLLFYTGSLFLSFDVFGSGYLQGSGLYPLLLACGCFGLILPRSAYLRRASATTFLVLLWVGWMFSTSLIWGTGDTVRFWAESNIGPVLLWPSIYLFFYVLCRKCPTVCPFVILFFCLLAGLCAIVFCEVYLRQDKRAAVLVEVYYPLLILPWIMLLKRPVWRYLGMATVAFLVFLSLKRTALLVLASSSLVWLVVHTLLTYRKKGEGIGALVLVVLAVVLSALAFYRLDESQGGEYVARLQSSIEDRGSGRVDIYEEVVDLISESSLEWMIFGHGHNAVIRHLSQETSAHNDWLEVQFDFGVGGTVLYSLLHLSLIVKSRRLIRERSPYAAAFAMSYVMFCLMSATSHLIIYPSYIIFLVAFWGMVEGLTRGEQSHPLVPLPGLGIFQQLRGSRQNGLLQDGVRIDQTP